VRLHCAATLPSEQMTNGNGGTIVLDSFVRTVAAARCPASARGYCPLLWLDSESPRQSRSVALAEQRAARPRVVVSP
jgi:hypothetical protein